MVTGVVIQLYLRFISYPLGETVSTEFTSLLLRSSQNNSVRCSTHQLLVFQRQHTGLCVFRRITLTWIWSEKEPWLKVRHLLSTT